MKAKGPTEAFSGRFGLQSQCLQIKQKGESVALDLSGGQRSGRLGGRLAMPVRTTVSDRMTNEQKLGVSQSAEPDPTLVIGKGRRATGLQRHDRQTTGADRPL
jgi:hypothetical protein